MFGKKPIGGRLPIEVELLAEAAWSLKHVGHTLDKQLAELEALRDELGKLSGPERARKLEWYRELRKQAEYRRWCYIVQREALGLYNHDDVDRYYPVPPVLH